MYSKKCFSIRNMRFFSKAETSCSPDVFHIGSIELSNIVFLDGLDDDLEVQIISLDTNEGDINSSTNDIINDVSGAKFAYNLIALSKTRFKSGSKMFKGKTFCTMLIQRSSHINRNIPVNKVDLVLPEGYSIRETYTEQCLDIADHVLRTNENALSSFLNVSVVVQTSDLKILFVQSSKLGDGKFLIRTPSTKVDMKVNEHESGGERKMDLKLAVRSALIERCSLQDSDVSKVELFAICFEKEVCNYGAFGFVELNLSSSELQNRFQGVSGTILSVDFNLPAIIKFLKEDSFTFTEFTFVNLIISLLKKRANNSCHIKRGFTGRYWSEKFPHKLYP